MDSIHSLQKEIGQYHNDKYLWEKKNDYEYINFKIMDSIKSIEKENEQYRNKQNLWDKQYKGGKQHKGGKPGYTSFDILYFCNKHKIKCFGYDWKMQQFITNKNEGIDFNKKYSCFCILF